jgi:hypothetical protein
MAVENLDAKGMDVLEAIHEAGGRASTGEVKDLTGIEKNAIVLYRFDKMEELGLVETESGEASGNRIPPRVAVLTEKAKEMIRGGLFADEEPTVVERMDRLERQFKQVTEEVHDLQGEFRQFRYDPENDEEIDVRGLIEEVQALQAMLEELDPSKVEEATGVKRSVTRVEDRQKTRAKYLNRSRSFDGTSKSGDEPVPVDARDVYAAIHSLENEVAQIAAALEASGVEPVEEDGYFALGFTPGDFNE